jgi:ligand-binding sensor domain-containing protein/signal transduction histidine kinase
MAATADADNVVVRAARGAAARICGWLGHGLLWLAVSGIGRAEDPGWMVRNWQTEDGLPDSGITAIEQTADGFLWVGTPKGLARFDGLRFKVFGPQQVPAMGGGRITALLEDRRGVLWIATGDGRLLRHASGRFTAVEALEPAAVDREGGFIKDAGGRALPLAVRDQATLVEDAAGAVWCWWVDHGLWCIQNGTVTRHTEATGLPAGGVGGLCADEAGQVWVVAANSLVRWSGGQWRRPAEVEVSPGQLPPLVAAARGGGIWVASAAGGKVDGGRLIRRFADGTWRQQMETTPWTPNSMRSEVTALLADRAGRVWLGLLWNGIWGAEPGQPWQQLAGELTLSQCVITCLFEDRHGLLWVGTDREGLHCVSRRPVAVLKLPASASENIITASCATRDGTIWVGTDGAGAFRYRGGDFESFGVGHGLQVPHVCSIFEDRHGNLWFGTWGGLYQFTAGRFARVTGLPELAEAVLALFEDRCGRLWVGTQGGLVCRDREQWGSRRLPGDSGVLDIRALAEDATGSLWVGTIGQGLFRVNGEQVTQFRNSGGFPGQDARALFGDPAGGAVWIGTMNHGLVRFQDGRFTTYSGTDGLPSETIGSIVPDGAGNLWIGSDHGIFACQLRVLETYQRERSPALLVTHLTMAEGLLSRACSGSGQPVPCQTADGRLWFPNYRGLAGFDPRLAAGRTEPTGVQVDAVVIDGTVSSAALAGSVRASSRSRRFEFQFTAPELIAPQALRFRYRLTGMDPDWVNAGNQRSATYSQLPPGEYQFQVMAGGADGRWHEAAEPLRLAVVPRLWEIRWVRWLAGLLAAGMTVGGLVLSERRRHARRLARIQQARAVEQERQRIAANIHDELGASLTRITLLSDLVRDRAQAGGIGAELEQIQTTSRNLTRAMDEVVWAIAPEHDTLDSLVTYLGKLAQDLLSAGGVSCRLEIPPTLPDVALSGQARHSLLLAVKEALHNVVKHAGATEARLQAAVRAGQIELVVADNGRGFDAHGGEPVAVPAGGRRAAGRGLGNLAMRLREIGGRCEITSTPGSGTRIRFTVPLGAGGVNPPPAAGHQN